MSNPTSPTLSLSSEVLEISGGYQGNLLSCVGHATLNIPVNMVKPLVIPFYEFSSKNALTTEKTNIFSSIAIGYDVANIKLFRLKYDVVVGYDDPKLFTMSKQFGAILSELNSQFEEVLFHGITPEYGLSGNSKTSSFTEVMDTIDDFVSALSKHLEDMVKTLGKGDYSIYFPLGWYSDFANVSGTPADQYCTNALEARAARLGVSLSLYDSLVVDKITIVRNDDVNGYFGRMPLLSSTIEDARKEEMIYRFSFDTPALVLNRQGSVRAISKKDTTPPTNPASSPVVLNYSKNHENPEAKITKSK